jgi:hypothetical protein
VHALHAGGSDTGGANWHAHLLITTRRLEGEDFAAKKVRVLDPKVRSAGGRAVVADAGAWGAVWRHQQNRYFHAHGLDLRVDSTATHAGQHLGPVPSGPRCCASSARSRSGAGDAISAGKSPMSVRVLRPRRR